MSESIYRGVTVKEGTFLYGTVSCDVRIVRTEMRQGSGDYEDPPEIQDDQPGTYFYIEWGSTTKRGEFSAGGGGCPTLAGAVEAAEKQVGNIKWIDQTVP